MPLARCLTMPAVALLLLAPCHLEAQGELFRDAWRWADFDRRAGLGDAAVNSVTTDQSGVTWLGVNGLLYFDGWQWRPVRGAAKGNALVFPRPHGGVFAVIDGAAYVGDTAGVRLVGTAALGGGGRILAAAVVGDAMVALIDTGGKRQLWLVTAGGAARRLTPPAADTQLSGESTVWQGSAGTAILVASTGVYRWNGIRWTTMVTWVRGLQARLLAEQSDGTGMLVMKEGGPASGVWEWIPGGTPTWRQEPGDAQIRTLAVDSSGTWLQWYYDDKYRVRGRGGAWSEILRVPHPVGSVDAVHFERSGAIWIAGRSGVHVYRRGSTRWTDLAQLTPSPFDRVNAIAPMSDGTFWLGTTGGVLVVDTANGMRTLRRIPDASGARLRTVTAVARDSSGGVWVASGADIDGVYRWDGTAWRHFGRADGLLARRIHDIVVDRKGIVWLLSIGTWDNFGGGDGAFAWDGKRFTHWGTAEGLGHRRVYAFADGPDGSRWFGTAGGLSRWKGGTWTHWTTRPATPDEASPRAPFRVFTLTLDAGGRPYFGDQMSSVVAYGIGTIDAGDSVRLLAPRGGQAHERIWKLAFDSAGTLWATTHRGLAAVREREREWFAFGDGFGLHSAPWPLLVGRDQVFVGTAAGLQALRMPSLVNPPPRVTVEAAVFAGNRIVTRWSAHAWNGTIDPDLIETRYRLDDEPWSPWSNERALNIVGAGPGNHTLAFEAKELFGSMEPFVTTAVVHVPLPIYRRPAFLIPLSVLCAIIAGMGYRANRRSRIADRQLRDSEQRLRLLTDASFDGIAVTRGSEIVDANRQLADLLRVPQAELLHRSVWDFIPPEEVHHVSRERLRGIGASYPSVLRRADGTEIPVEIRTHALSASDDTLRITALRDLSEQRALETRIARAHRLEAVGRLAGGIAHDFNNILTGILGSAELATLELRQPASLVRRLDAIRESGQRATELVRQILTFSRPHEPAMAMVELVPLVDETVRLLRTTIPAGVAIEVNVREPVPPIEADRSQLRQVLVHLCSNSYQAMGAQGLIVIGIGGVDVGAPEVARAPEELAEEPAAKPTELGPGRYAVLTVRDTGPGMDAQVVARAFEPFFTTKNVGEGTGLGLAVVHGIVRAHRGHVTLESAPGVGTTCRVYLPASRPMGAPG